MQEAYSYKQLLSSEWDLLIIVAYYAIHATCFSSPLRHRHPENEVPPPAQSILRPLTGQVRAPTMVSRLQALQSGTRSRGRFCSPSGEQRPENSTRPALAGFKPAQNGVRNSSSWAQWSSNFDI